MSKPNRYDEEKKKSHEKDDCLLISVLLISCCVANTVAATDFFPGWESEVNSGDAEYKTTTRVTTLYSYAYFVYGSGDYDYYSMYAPYYEGEDFFVP